MPFDPLRALNDRVHRVSPDTPHPVAVRAAVAAAVVAGAVSFSVALRQYGPTVHPDEWGFLLNGQMIVGHDQAPIPTGSFYPAGFGLVTGPLAVLTGSLHGAYRATLIVNFLLCLAVAWAAHAACRRVMGAGTGLSVLAAVLVFVAPGTIVTSLYAWPETAARLSFLCMVLWLHSVASRRTARAILPFALYVGLLPGLHGRFTLVLPVVCLLFLWWGLSRDVPRVAALGACGVTAAGYAAGHLLNTFVKSRLYTTSYDQENRLLRRLVDPGVWPALVRTMTGQAWYLVATTGGLAAIAIAYAVSQARSAGSPAAVRTDPRRVTLTVVALSSALVVFTGGLQLLYGNRGDHLIYGRYVEILVPALLVVACGAVGSWGASASLWWLRGAVVTVVVAVVYVAVDMGDGVKGGWSRNDIVFPNIVGTDAIRYLVRPGLLTFGVTFAVIGTLLWLLAARNGTWAVAAAAVLLAAGSAWSAEQSVLPRTGDLRASGVTVEQVKAGGAVLVGFDQGVRNDRSYYYLRYKLDPVKLVRFDVSGPDAVIPPGYSCVYAMPGRPPSDGEWRIVADEPVLQRVLFQRVGTDHC